MEFYTVQADATATSFEKGSEADFITEHYWGYTRIDKTQTAEYEVKHPSWEIYNVNNHTIDIDFEENYGKDFAILNQQEPISIMLAEGSEISVGNKNSV